MTNNKQQTAVDWFAENILTFKQGDTINNIEYIIIQVSEVEYLKEQSKEVERCQHRNTWIDSHIEQIPMHFGKYYEQTYGGCEQ
jgi:hypothetical protein